MVQMLSPPVKRQLQLVEPKVGLLDFVACRWWPKMHIGSFDLSSSIVCVNTILNGSIDVVPRVRLTITTVAAILARPMAVALPIPEFAPVIMHTFPFTFSSPIF